MSRAASERALSLVIRVPFAWWGTCHCEWVGGSLSSVGKSLSAIQKHAIQQLDVEPQQRGPTQNSSLKVFMNNECRTW